MTWLRSGIISAAVFTLAAAIGAAAITYIEAEIPQKVLWVAVGLAPAFGFVGGVLGHLRSQVETRIPYGGRVVAWLVVSAFMVAGVTISSLPGADDDESFNGWACDPVAVDEGTTTVQVQGRPESADPTGLIISTQGERSGQSATVPMADFAAINITGAWSADVDAVTIETRSDGTWYHAGTDNEPQSGEPLDVGAFASTIDAMRIIVKLATPADDDVEIRFAWSTSGCA